MIAQGRPIEPATSDSRGDLQWQLMQRAENLHQYVENKIPFDLRTWVTSDEVMQEVWVAAFRYGSRVREEDPHSFDRWLKTVAESRLLNAIRNARRAQRKVRGAGAPPDSGNRTSALNLLSRTVDGRQRTPSSEDASREAVHAIRSAIDSLPEEYRQAVTLHHIEGRPLADIADAMQKSRPAVNSLLHRGLRKLRDRLGAAASFFSDDGSSDTRMRSDL